MSCGAPPPLTDGDTKYTTKSQYSHNESVEYMCSRYYTMEGEPYRTCISGEWTGQLRCLSKLQLSSHLIFILHSLSWFFIVKIKLNFRIVSSGYSVCDSLLYHLLVWLTNLHSWAIASHLDNADLWGNRESKMLKAILTYYMLLHSLLFNLLCRSSNCPTKEEWFADS